MQLLQKSRQLDWRFLLPDPRLGDVACLGTQRSGVQELLQLFSKSVTVIGKRPRPCATYDLVVANSPTYETLQWTTKLVRPGGSLYVEAYGGCRKAYSGRLIGFLSHSTRPRLCCAADYVAALGQLGFDEVTAHWHWPNFERCQEIVPLGHNEAMLLFLSRRRGSTAGLLKASLARCLLRMRLLEHVLACFSLVARRSGFRA